MILLSMKTLKTQRTETFVVEIMNVCCGDYAHFNACQYY